MRDHNDWLRPVGELGAEALADIHPMEDVKNLPETREEIDITHTNLCVWNGCVNHGWGAWLKPIKAPHELSLIHI